MCYSIRAIAVCSCQIIIANAVPITEQIEISLDEAILTGKSI